MFELFEMNGEVRRHSLLLDVDMDMHIDDFTQWLVGRALDAICDNWLLDLLLDMASYLSQKDKKERKKKVKHQNGQKKVKLTYKSNPKKEIVRFTPFPAVKSRMTS
jgi:hypothetical protein